MTSLLVFRDTITQSPFFNETSLAIHTHDDEYSIEFSFQLT